jgi:hypothetical protein
VILLRSNCVFAGAARAHAGEVHDAVANHLLWQALNVLLLEDWQRHVAGAAHAVARRVHDAVAIHLLLKTLYMHAVAGEECMKMLLTNCCCRR